MSEAITIARPYAQAVFEYAVENKQLNEWATVLNILKAVTEDAQGQMFLTNPAVSQEMQHDFFMRIVKSVIANNLLVNASNFLKLICTNKRVMLLPEIADVYSQLKAQEEKLLTVDVKTFMPLDTKHQEKLSQALAKKFDSQINLEISIVPELLGGMIIKASDLVIDGSIRGQLNKLGQVLGA